MRYGFVLPGGTATEQLEQAVLAERAGWDGVFIWEAAYGVDAWTLLGAMAQRTERLRLGTMLTPLPWRRPWKLASQAATLDQLSGGRAILAVGLGAVGSGLERTGEATDRRTRAELLDEGAGRPLGGRRLHLVARRALGDAPRVARAHAAGARAPRGRAAAPRLTTAPARRFAGNCRMQMQFVNAA